MPKPQHALRSTNRQVMLNSTEAREVDKAAYNSEKSFSEWAREVLVREARKANGQRG